MRKLLLALITLVALPHFIQAQTYKTGRIDVVYSNGLYIFGTAKDSVLPAANDTVDFSLYSPEIGAGYLPVSITIAGNIIDADISGASDSVMIDYQIGNGLFYTEVGADSVFEVATTGAFIREIAFPGNGANSATNTQASVLPIGDRVRMILRQVTNDGDTTAYQLSITGKYKIR